MGIATTNIPFFSNILLDSTRNLLNGLKCWADSNAIILSRELSANGNTVEIAFTKDNLSVSFKCGNSNFKGGLSSLEMSFGNRYVILFPLREPSRKTPNFN